MTLFDTHCHLQDEAFGSREAEAVVLRAVKAGVGGMLVCGYGERSNVQALALADAHEPVFAAVGFHPHEAKDVTPALLDALARQAADDRVVAVGEIGLDFFRDHSPRDVQRQVLDTQLELAITVGKPVSVHSRAAEGEILEQLARYSGRSPLGAAGRPVGVMHCFGGTLEQALGFVDLGFLISMSCAITYPKNDEARRIATGVPLEWMVVETDSPYLPPQTRRGGRNEPAFVAAAAAGVAKVRGISVEAVAEATTANACRVFGVRPVLLAEVA